MRRVALLAALSAALFGGPAAADVVAEIKLSQQTMVVSVDGVVHHVWRVSTGRSGWRTPTGTFRPQSMQVRHFSTLFNGAPMPYSIFFTPDGHAIHGSLETRRLGKAVSHGCIRLDPRNAAVLYDLVTAEGLGKTEVIVTNGAGPAIVSQTRAPESVATQKLATLIQQSPSLTGTGQLY